MPTVRLYHYQVGAKMQRLTTAMLCREPGEEGGRPWSTSVPCGHRHHGDVYATICARKLWPDVPHESGDPS